MFKTSTYKERRLRLKNLVGSGIILFLGNEESSMNYNDNTYHFRQDSSFLYYFGLDEPFLAAIIDCESGEEILFGNDKTIDEIVWMGYQPVMKEKAERVGVLKVLPLDNLRAFLQEVQNKKRSLHFLPPYRPETSLKLFSLLLIPPGEMAQKSSVSLIQAIVDQRTIKTAEEIAEIEKAVNVTAEMQLKSMRLARPGISEAVLAAGVRETALAHGYDLAFPIILTIHGETLHNHSHHNILKENDLVLNDCGAETDLHYAGDLSRTFPAGKKFTARQKEIYLIAQAAHEAAIVALKPGINFRAVHLLACKRIASGLKDLGLMKGDVDEAVAAGAHALFFPCGTGHMMGLDVHDMENLGEKYVGYAGREKSTQFGLKSLRLARELQPGFVLTVEPGIYFIPQLIDLWKKENRLGSFINYAKVEEYRDFGGLRSEEDFLITETGYRRLGVPLAKTIAEIEQVREEALA